MLNVDESLKQFNIRSCRAAFLHAFATLLAHYREFLRYPSHMGGRELANFFDTTAFLNLQPRSFKVRDEGLLISIHCLTD